MLHVGKVPMHEQRLGEKRGTIFVNMAWLSDSLYPSSINHESLAYDADTYSNYSNTYIATLLSPTGPGLTQYYILHKHRRLMAVNTKCYYRTPSI